MTEHNVTAMDDIDQLGPFSNSTNLTSIDDGGISGEDQSTFLSDSDSYIFITTAIFSICYFLVGVTCCRCYWLHLRKKSETNRSIEGGLEAVVSKKEGKKEGKETNSDSQQEDNQEPNEFLQPWR